MDGETEAEGESTQPRITRIHPRNPCNPRSLFRFRRDRFAIHELSILDLKDNRGFVRVALGIKRDLARYAGKIFRLRDSLAKLRSLCGTCTLDRIEQNHCRVISETCQRIRHGVET